MIAKATPHDNGVRLARYLITGKEGEIAMLWGLTGFASVDIVEAFRSVHVMAAGTQCRKPFLHIQVRNRDTEFLTRDQWRIVANRIERMLGLSGQPHAIAFHTDRRTGGVHMHLAFSRIDHETLTARKLPFFKRRLNTLSRELETELGLTSVRADRAGVIKYAPLRPQEEQARRLGVDIRRVLETIRECFDRTDCGRSFAAGLAYQDLTLAQGERRDYVVIDHAGGVHALGKRILDVSAAQIRVRLSDLTRESLPTVEQVRQRISAIEGSRKKQEAKKHQGTRWKQQRLLAPAIERSSQRATEDQLAWTTGPTSLSLTARRPEPVSTDGLPSLNGENAPEIPTSGFREAREAIPLPGPAISTETDLAGYRPEPEIEHQQSTPHKSAGFADVLKRQFRAVVRALVERIPSPQYKARRRRRGETIGSFGSAARRLLRPIISLPRVPQTIAFLNDALPWLHLWEWNEPTEHVIEDEPASTTGNHLSPHP